LYQTALKFCSSSTFHYESYLCFALGLKVEIYFERFTIEEERKKFTSSMQPFRK